MNLNAQHYDNIHVIASTPDRLKHRVVGYLPSNSIAALIQSTQTFWGNKSFRFKGITITAQNMRYAVHSDSGASANRATQIYEDCLIEHLGNDEALAWQAANGGSPSSIWAATSALGCGLHSGERIFSRNTIWRSQNKPFYFHDNINFDEPCHVEIDGGACIATCNQATAVSGNQYRPHQGRLCMRFQGDGIDEPHHRPPECDAAWRDQYR